MNAHTSIDRNFFMRWMWIAIAMLPAAAHEASAKAPPGGNVAYQLYNEASSLWRRHEFDESLETFGRALAEYESQLGPDHPQVGGISYAQAERLMALGRYAEAEAPCRRALKIYGDGDEKSYSFAACLALMGKWHHIAGNEKQALDDIRRAVSICEAVDRSSEGKIKLLTDAAHFYTAIGGPSPEVERLLRRVLELREKELGKDNPQLRDALVDLTAVVPKKQQDELIARLLELRRSTYTRDEFLVARSLQTQAERLVAEKRFDEAAKLYEYVLAVRGRGPAEYLLLHPLTLRTMERLLPIYKQLGATEKADLLQALYKERQERAQRDVTAERFLAQTPSRVRDDGGDQSIGPTEWQFLKSASKAGTVHLTHLARFYLANNRLDDAAPLLQRILAIYDKEAPDDRKLIMLCAQLGAVAKIRGHKEPADEYYQRALDLAKKKPTAGTTPEQQRQSVEFVSLLLDELHDRPTGIPVEVGKAYPIYGPPLKPAPQLQLQD